MAAADTSYLVDETFVWRVYQVSSKIGVSPRDLPPDEVIRLLGLKAGDVTTHCPECKMKGHFEKWSSDCPIALGVPVGPPAIGECGKHCWWPFSGVILTPMQEKVYCGKPAVVAEITQWLGLERCWRACQLSAKDKLKRASETPPCPVLCFLAAPGSHVPVLLSKLHSHVSIDDIYMALYEAALDKYGLERDVVKGITRKALQAMIKKNRMEKEKEEEEEDGGSAEEEEKEKELKQKKKKRRISLASPKKQQHPPQPKE